VLTIIGGDLYDPSKASSPHRHGVLRAMNRRLMNDADRVVAISTDTRYRAQEFYSVTRPIEVIPYGFHPPGSARRSAGTSNGEEFALVAVGRLVKRKGFSFLIEAVSRLPDQVKLRLVGDGPLDAELRALARERGVENRVEFLGFQDRQSILELMSNSDCFVLSSLHEGLGIVVQEAMFSGLPIVATDEGGQVDLVSDGEGGFLIKPGDSGALADAVRRVMMDPGLAETFGSHNQARIRQLTGEAMSAEYLALFHELLREGIPAARAQPLPR
jgi:glycosyltransferase involved in cell wall biosynthesis